MKSKKDEEQEMPENNEAKKKGKKIWETDLPDNPHDEERMKPEEFTLDLPDVNEIPGQEHIHVPRILEMQDVTIASDDEEGVSVFGNDEDDEQENLAEVGNIPSSKFDDNLIETLTDEDSDDEDLKKAGLDQVDTEGAPLNEGSMTTDVSGGDLDTSGTDEDDAMEEIGEEDEENNLYSLGGDNNESLEEDKGE